VDVLRKRYGSRLENLVPTPANGLYLYGGERCKMFGHDLSAS